MRWERDRGGPSTSPPDPTEFWWCPQVLGLRLWVAPRLAWGSWHQACLQLQHSGKPHSGVQTVSLCSEEGLLRGPHSERRRRVTAWTLPVSWGWNWSHRRGDGQWLLAWLFIRLRAGLWPWGLCPAQPHASLCRPRAHPRAHPHPGSAT